MWRKEREQDSSQPDPGLHLLVVKLSLSHGKIRMIHPGQNALRRNTLKYLHGCLEHRNWLFFHPGAYTFFSPQCESNLIITTYVSAPNKRCPTNDNLLITLLRSHAPSNPQQRLPAFYEPSTAEVIGCLFLPRCILSSLRAQEVGLTMGRISKTLTANSQRC